MPMTRNDLRIKILEFLIDEKGSLNTSEIAHKILNSPSRREKERVKEILESLYSEDSIDSGFMDRTTRQIYSIEEVENPRRYDRAWFVSSTKKVKSYLNGLPLRWAEIHTSEPLLNSISNKQEENSKWLLHFRELKLYISCDTVFSLSSKRNSPEEYAFVKKVVNSKQNEILILFADRAVSGTKSFNGEYVPHLRVKLEEGTIEITMFGENDTTYTEGNECSTGIISRTIQLIQRTNPISFLKKNITKVISVENKPIQIKTGAATLLTIKPIN
ncbi:hypothetical protein A9Q84_00190 [Halobacteriovorax marinus]|uniref:Uncharacterized protein n=1 Tax=Halobacteriovorax marinus TaxID=97084 RepID=A0A1Y5FDF3_9BACT|nr:hypothetical protein A9Q84_00190 [Halobacteriovorax marinus]